MNKLFRTITVSQDSHDFVQLHNAQDIEHKIIIKELELMMSIGVLPEERQSKQRVLVNIEISLKTKNSYEDNIQNTISYADIIDRIKHLSMSKHFNLVETLASEISDICLNEHQALKVSVSIQKPDIISEVKSVGFAMTREK
jgi:dihydroneopterin aldolase